MHSKSRKVQWFHDAVLAALRGLFMSIVRIYGVWPDFDAPTTTVGRDAMDNKKHGNVTRTSSRSLNKPNSRS